MVGAGAVVASALVYHLLTSGSDDSNSSNKMIEEIEALGPVQKEKNGIVKFQFYKDVFTIVGRHGRTKFAKEKKEMVANRRKALKDGDMAKYTEIVKDIIQKEEMQMGDLMQEVMDHLNISEQEFMMTQQVYMQNQKTA